MLYDNGPVSKSYPVHLLNNMEFAYVLIVAIYGYMYDHAYGDYLVMRIHTVKAKCSNCISTYYLLLQLTASVKTTVPHVLM